MYTRIFNFAAIAAMSAMPMIANAEDKTVGERIGDAVDKVAGNKEANNAAIAPQFPPGITIKETKDIDDIRGSLTKIVNRVLTRDGFDDAVAYLVNQDRDRIKGQMSDDRSSEMNARVDQVRALFKQKYGEDFDLQAALLNTSTAIRQGEVQDAVTARVYWPLNPGGDQKTSQDFVDHPNKVTNDDPKFEKGRDVAAVRLTGLTESDTIALSLQHELPDYWVMDLPNNVNAAGLMQSENQALQTLIDKQDNWPKTKEEAYRVISYKILHGFLAERAGAPVTEMPRN